MDTGRHNGMTADPLLVRLISWTLRDGGGMVIDVHAINLT